MKEWRLISVSDDHRMVARKIADELFLQGFGPHHLDDIIYAIADEICGSLDGDKACEEEYGFANELNTHTMVDQLSVLFVWFGTEEKMRSKLSIYFVF